MKMANTRHRNEKLQTYRALAFNSMNAMAGSILPLVSEITVAAIAASPSIPTRPGSHLLEGNQTRCQSGSGIGIDVSSIELKCHDRHINRYQ